MKKNITLIALLSIGLCGNAQRLSDSAMLHMSDQELGLHYLQTSRNQKTAGYVFAGIAVVSSLALPIVLADEVVRSFEGEKVSGGGSIAVSVIVLGSTAASIGLISAGARNSGKAEMYLRTKPADEPPGHELTLGMQYQKKAMKQRVTGYALLASGVSLMLIAPSLYNPEKGETSSQTSDIVNVCGLVSTCASLPFLLSATKNKGRASILLKKESIPFSYYSKPIGLNSLALAIPIGN